MILPKCQPDRLWKSALLGVLVHVGSLGLASGGILELDDLPGIVVDDTAAEKTGEWLESTKVGVSVGAGYIFASKPGAAIKYMLAAPADGDFHLRVSYTASGNRPDNVPVTVESAAGKQSFSINQRKPPSDGVCFHELAVLRLKKGQAVTVTISNEGASGSAIADAVQLLKKSELVAAAKALNKVRQASPPPPKPDPKKEEKPPPPPQPVAEPFKRVAPSNEVAKIEPGELDTLVEKSGATLGKRLDDDRFLRRVTLDLVGRQPTLDEMRTFRMDPDSSNRKASAVDRLLELPEFGTNWAKYFSDVFRYRQQEPELTFHDYGPFLTWLEEGFNADVGWDEITYRLLTATGKVGDHPESTFIAFHQGNANRIAGETTRAFLGVQIACAECHDHPFVDMKQETFHQMAAFFVRTEAKVSQLNSDGIEVKSKDKGEQRIPGGKTDILPVAFGSEKSLGAGAADIDRRTILARYITNSDNRMFSRAYVNRVWWYLMGKAFVEPVDDMQEGAEETLPEVHRALADHFVATDFSTKELLRVIVLSQAYQQEASADMDDSLVRVNRRRLRGSEMYAALATAIELPDLAPPREKKSGAVRFPPPPKSTSDVLDDTFGFDPSIEKEDAPRTMRQALYMMNNPELQAQVNADPDSGTWLAKLLISEGEDKTVIDRMYQTVLSRPPSDEEMGTVLTYMIEIRDRNKVFEDLLWALLNSTEFTTRP